MIKIFKRLDLKQSILAIIFLLFQIGSALYLPYITADIINKGIVPGDTALIWSKGLIMIGLSIASLLGEICNTFLFSRMSYKLGNELRKDVYDKVFSFSKIEFDTFGTASLITRNTTDIHTIQTLIEFSFKFLILAPAYLFGGILMTYLLNPKLSFIFIGVIPFLALASFIVYTFANPLYSKIQKVMDTLNLVFREGLTGVKVIRSFNKEHSSYKKYKQINKEYTKTFISAETIMSAFIPVAMMLISIASIVIIWIGAKSITTGSMEIGTIISAISYSAQITMGFAMLTNVILIIPKGQISAKRIYEVLDTHVGINDPIKEKELDKKVTLEFNHVTFRYVNTQKDTLNDINFSVDIGQTLAIIGSIGEGKSTLINLIPRFYDVNKGKVKINGVDTRDINKNTLQDIISFTPQKTSLFLGTIRSNMLLGKKDATDDEIWKALDTACASEFVKELVDGLDHIVQKDGGNFSGGQKQRLCIARSLLKDASIYIFDDSFSALDFKTDSTIRNTMKEKLKDKITVIVAQRISTIMNADLIAVLDRGTLVGLGTHKELQKTNAVYNEIMESQYYKKEVSYEK